MSPLTSRGRLSRIASRGLLVAAALASTSLLIRAQTGDVNYVYDDSGRLIAVVAPSGEAAVYNYDAVGNLLSITRTPANTVSIIDFAPKSGPVGSTVRVWGTGFSATPAQNTATFDTVPATIDSASLIELVVTVPAGATTGPIGVTSPAGSAATAVDFVVGSPPAAPDIVQFSPAIGTPGTAVTIDGSNFEATSPGNIVALNATRVNLTAVSATSLSTTVPINTTSGRISVRTPHGTGVSTDDFFVPPSPYGAGDVDDTGRIPFATAHTATIATAGRIGLHLFDGDAGQRVFLKIGPGVASVVRILSTDTGLVGASTFGGVINAFIDTRTLTRTGTHTVFVDPTGSATGNLTLTLYDVPPDVTGSLTFGTGFPLSISTPGQNALLSFTGTAGQRVSHRATGGLPGTISILKPDGSSQASVTNGVFGSFIDTITLATAGSYTVFIDPSWYDTGSTTLTLYDVPDDFTGSITPGGSGVAATIVTPGQNGTLSFSGTAGQRVSLRISNGLGCKVSILRPDGSTQASVTTTGIFNSFIDTITLAATDTYSIFIDGTTNATGTATLTLYDVPGDLTGTLTINGSAEAVAIGTPGQNASYTFSGTASQQVTVKITGNTYGSVAVRLLRPNGTVLTQATSSSTNFNLSTQTLPTTGTYTVVIDPASFNTGTLNVSVTNP